MNSTFIDIRRDLHKIPELGFKEYKTQAYILDYIKKLNAPNIDIKTWETGVLVKVNGTDPSKIIGYRADMDGLPIKEATGLPFASEHDGLMHACGHDFHMAIALGVLSVIAANPIKDDVLFIFQPAEEGPGGAEPLMKSGVLGSWKPDMVIGLHVAPEYPVGTIATKNGLLFANTSELFIDFTGKGGHAAYPHKSNDMVIAACQFVNQLQTIVSRNVDPLDSAVVTIGMIVAGTVQNSIAETARLEGTIRTLSAEAMEHVQSRVEALAKGVEIGFDCKIDIDYGSMYYEVFNEAKLTEEFCRFVESSQMELSICKEAMTGEDFGYMLKEIPGFMFWLGVGSEYGLHHSKLMPDEAAIPKTVQFLADYLAWKSGR